MEEVQMWRYFRDNRAYKDTVILLSPTADFSADKTLVLWNSNGTANGQTATWTNGGTGPTTFTQGTDPLYVETSAGKTFKVYDSNVSWLNGSKDNLPTQEAGKNRFDARYVRVYMNGNLQYSDANMSSQTGSGASNHLIEVKVYGEPNLKDQVVYTNLASNSGVSVSTETSSDRPASWAVNGDKDNANNDYTDPGNNAGGPQWIQLDMGIEHDVEKVVLYRYWTGRRQYCNTVVMLSADKNFSPDSTLVLWNANNAAAGRNGVVQSWPGAGNGSAGNTHTLPEGIDPLYPETENGKTFNVYDSNVSWLFTDETRPITDKHGGK